MSGATATLARTRGRPQGPASHLLDATAWGQPLPAWDREEFGLIAQVYDILQRLRYGRENAPEVARQLDAGLALIRRWAAGDRRENERHAGMLDSLRRANALLDPYRPIQGGTTVTDDDGGP